MYALRLVGFLVVGALALVIRYAVPALVVAWIFGFPSLALTLLIAIAAIDYCLAVPAQLSKFRANTY